ncbi:ATP-dependent DNA helicase [Rhodotorula toruloides]|uniref:ATP-dependent RNA helicase n=1 Tax=Rhodotorula toruloides TaxID=5286 RepID=A0A511KM93_RHOTO|nr:ATP-dependent DNA helicase [Rhodotorula toruloides]
MAATEDFGGWQPAPGESPAEREKRLKREKRAAKLAEVTSSSAAPRPQSNGKGGESFGGWTPAPGESPAEREKRLKREKRAQKIAQLNGGSGGGQASYDAPPHVGSSAPRESYGGWQPAPGESPAEREKRLKREKRAAMLASQGGAPPPTDVLSAFVPPPASLSTAVPPASDAGTADTVAKKSKNVQSLTTARLKYLKRKKNKRKAKKVAQPKGKKRAEDVDGGEGDEKLVVGQKRQREESDSSDDGSDESDDEEGKPAPSSASAGQTKWPELSEDQRKAKLDIIAQKKAERREKRLAKKAEIKRIEAEGGVVPPPKPRVVETTKPRVRQTAIVKEPTPPPVEEEKQEPTEEELAEQRRQEEIAARKALKALKKQQRRLPEEERKAALAKAEAELLPPQQDANGDVSMVDSADHEENSKLIPTAPGAAVDKPALPRSPSPTAPASPPAPLYRLPSATRPAPPSAKVLSALNVHRSVRDKQVVDPTQKVSIGDKLGEDGTGVGERGRKRLKGEMGVEEWFAVQTAVLPLLLPPSAQPPALYSPFNPPRDVCVSAPTGSGKTLSYVVPIVETLQQRVVTRLRALVLLPTRDLVGQVRETFEQYAKGTGLKVGVATGQHPFSHEQSVLVGDNIPADVEGGASQVDILIATPGRLMDHLKWTAGFSLQHLRFLVVDEADRLLTQSFHDWLPTVLSALKPSFSPPALGNDDRSMSAKREKRTKRTATAIKKADAMAPSWWDAEGKVGRVASDLDERCQGSCQKLLFSATLSRDPANIDALHLHRPVYISVEDALDPHAENEAIDSELKFTFPAELSEHMIISPASYKPLYLFHLLHTLSISSALCFTKSVESTTRLAKLVEFFEEARAVNGDGPEAKKVVVKAYSSELATSERNKVLREFKRGEVQMLICSDLIARGIDIPNISHVISYDIPVDMRKYVHRVGRTARAGNKGDAWSLVEEQEVAPFRSIMAKAQHYQKIQRVKVKDNLVEPFVPAYQVALERLKLYFATGPAREQSTA